VYTVYPWSVHRVLLLRILFEEMAEGEKQKKRVRTKGGLIRAVAYLHEDEDEALERAAKRLRTGRSEVIRRAIRAFLGIED
jgi:Ribbon-helix-helix protein, copG family